MTNHDGRAAPDQAKGFEPLGGDAPGSLEPTRDETLNRLIFLAVTVAILYFVGAKIGLALTFSPFPLAVL